MSQSAAVARDDPPAFDVGSLRWVKGEIDQSLERAVAALGEFVAQPAEKGRLAAARGEVHQAAGAVKMVGLEAVAAFTDEIEASLEWMGSAPAEAVPVMGRTIEAACQRLSPHLDELINDPRAKALELFPYYEAMQRGRGVVPSSPVDLFFPDLSIRPARPALGQQLEPAQLAALLLKARRVFQQGLLGWLRGTTEGMQQMRAAVQAIEHTQSGPQRTFWWTTTAFLDALLWRGLASGYSAKQLCARIDLQMRRFIEGSTKVADRLRREVLFHVAVSKPVAPSIEEVRTVYGLGELMPATGGADAEQARIAPALREARELMVPTKEAWLRLNSGRPDALQKLKQHLAALCGKAEVIGHGDLLRLARVLTTELNRMPVHPVPDAIALEYATALLLTESALENFSTLPADFTRTVGAMVQRLESGGTVSDPSAVPVLDEMARRAQERLLLAQVAKEIQTNLRHIEQVLDAFFRDHSRRQDLAAILHHCRQVLGALRILGLDRAEKLLALCQEQIARYAGSDTVVVDDELEMLAESLSGLGFYIEAIEQQRSDGDRLIEPLLRKRMGVGAEIRRERELSLEQTLETRLSALPAALAAIGGGDADAARSALRARLTAIRHDAELTANAALAQHAASALERVDDDTPAGRVALAELLERMARPATGEAGTTPSEDALRLVSVSKEKLDAELLDIYLAEAAEVLGSIAEHHARLASGGDDREALRTVRRGFHTLKGSGRMVGLTELGELAWAVEKALNRWLETDRVPTRSLLAMIEVASGSFAGWVEALRTTGEVTLDAAPLEAAVARVEAELAPKGPGGPGGGSGSPTPHVAGNAAATPPRPGPSLRLVEPSGSIVRVPLPGAPGPAAADLPDAVDLSVDASMRADPAEECEAAVLMPVGVGAADRADLDALGLALPNPDDDDVTVNVGQVRMSATLHRILCDEAAQHLDVLRTHVRALQANPALRPDDTAVRASHTLRGIHRTTEIEPVARAAGSLEECLVVLQALPGSGPEGTVALLDDALAILAQLLDRVRSAEPFRLDDLVRAGTVAAALDDLAVTCRRMVPPETLPRSPGPPDAGVPRSADGGTGGGGVVLVGMDGSVAGEASEAVAVATASDELPVLEYVAPAPASVAGTAGALAGGGELESVRDEIDHDLLPIFLEEAQELLPAAAESLREWQRDPQDPQPSARLRRILHTFKGSARMAGAMRLGELTHLMESRVLIDEGVAEPSAELVEQLHLDLDRVAWLLERLQQGEFDSSLPWAEGAVAQPGPEARADAAATAPVPCAGVGAPPGTVAAQAGADEPETFAARSPVQPVDPAPTPLAADPAAALLALDALDSGLDGGGLLADELAIAAELARIGEDGGYGTASAEPPEASLAAAAELAQSFPAAAFADTHATCGDLAPPPSLALQSPSAFPNPAAGDVAMPERDAPVSAIEAEGSITRPSEPAAESPAAPDAVVRASVEAAVGPNDAVAPAPEVRTGSGDADGPALEKGSGDAIAPAMAEALAQIEQIMRQDAAAMPRGVGVRRDPTIASGDAGGPSGSGARGASVAPRPASTSVSTPAGVASPSGDGPPEADTRERALLRVRADVVDRLVNEAGEVSIARARIESELRLLKTNLIELTNSVMRLRGQVRELEMHAETQIQSRLTQVQESSSEFDPLEFDRFTRFQELTRSLVEGINDVSTVQQSLIKNLDDANSALVAQARMSREVQQALFNIRTMPFASLGDRLHRVVRQTARELGKRAALEIHGAQVELDRSVLEKLVGPFEHLVRNAIDHGLESREGRRQAGKPEAGQLVVTVRQQGNEVVIALSDDGAGIDFARLRDRARSLGLIPPDAEPSHGQLVDWMFSAGFSTARAVTKISGRGIGLDVVRSDIAALGGRVEVASELGKGTTFTLVMPLTLAVAQVAIVRVGGGLFAVPSPMVEHVQQVKPEDLIELYRAGQMTWQGQTCPFHSLGRLLGVAGHTPAADRHNAVLLVRSGGNLVAVHADQMVGNQEVVVKNIGPQLSRVAGITGATVLGTGEIVLIINPVRLALRQEAAVASTVAAAPVGPLPQEKSEAREPRVLVVDDSLTVRKITSRLLTREGFDVLTARDGIEALQVLGDVRPDVILLDIEMPRMDGFELARSIRGDSRLNGIPIVMITSRTADKHRQRAGELGVQHYLGKPYQEEELLSTLRALVARCASATA